MSQSNARQLPINLILSSPSIQWDILSRISREGKGDNDCWIWAGSIREGKAMFKIDSLSYYTSRIIYLLKTKVDPGELRVHCKCGNLKCVNPNHLVTNTQLDNINYPIDDIKGNLILCGIKTVDKSREDIVQGKISDLEKDNTAISPLPAKLILNSSDIQERFWAKVDNINKSEEECHLWLGTKTAINRPVFIVNKIRYYAYRIAYLLKTGESPDGKLVLHRCVGKDNPLCCNIDHLYLGTHTDNQRDAVLYGNRHSVLHKDDVEEIIRMRKEGMKLQEIADIYDVTKQYICDIVNERIKLTF